MYAENEKVYLHFMLMSLSLPLSFPPAPQFVSMYEIGEHIYVFFSEEAVEAEPNKVSFWA